MPSSEKRTERTPRRNESGPGHGRSDTRQAACGCPCHHGRGTPGEGYSWVWDDDRGIRHEDWIDCKCENADATVCTWEAVR